MKPSQHRYRSSSRPYQGGAFFQLDEVITIDQVSGRSYTRHVVRHPGGSAVVAVIGTRAVLVSQYRPAIEQMILEVPAGRPTAGETSIETAHRELHEETGLSASQLQPLTKFYNAPCFCDGISHIFIATDFDSSASPKDPLEFPTAVRFIPLSDVEDWIADGRLVDAKTIISLLLARSWLAQRRHHEIE